MARAASGRLTAIQAKNAVSTCRALAGLVGLVGLVGSGLVGAAAHAQSRGLLASPDPLSAPLLAQQADPAPAAPPPSGDPAAGNAGPGAGGPTVNVTGNQGVPVPGKANQPQADQPGAEKKAQGMTFFDRIAGSSLFVQTGISIGTIFKGYQPDYNPSVSTFASFSPRFAISKDWQLRGRVAANLEYTNSDTTLSRNEVELLDSSLLLFYRGIPSLGGKVKLLPNVGVLAPTSKASRSRTMLFTPTIGLQAALPVEHVLGGDLMFIANASYGRPIYRQTTPTGLDERPYQSNCAGGAGSACGGQLSGVTNARDTLTTTAIVVGTWGKFSPGAFMLLNNQIAYKPRAAQGLDGSALPNGQDASRWRASTFFAAWLDLEVSDWVTPEIGYQQQRSLRNADGSFGNPFFSKYQEQIVYLGANVQLDSLLKKITGEEGKAGIVRAKAAPTPIRFY